MKSNTIYFGIKNNIIFLICFLFSAANLLANSESRIITLSKSSESQTIKSGEVPVGLDADEWHKIQKQIRDQRYDGRNPKLNNISLNPFKGGLNQKSEIQNFSSPMAPLYGTDRKITASDAQSGDGFGRSVAVAGDVAIVGAQYEDTGYGSAGAAYIFERNIGGTNVWGQVKKIVASDPTNNAYFGCSVAIAGDVVIVGAYSAYIGVDKTGAAYVFERNTNGGTNNWKQVKKLIASDAQHSDFFGYSVAVDGDVAVVGAYGEDTVGSKSGAAYVFERNANGGTNNWGEVKKLLASNPQHDDQFGRAVTVVGDVAVIGAERDDAAASNAGAAYVFERNANGGTNNWGEVKKLTASDAKNTDLFGCSVALDGDVAVVGAFEENSGGTDSGAAYVFERNTNGGTNNWGQIEKLVASDAQANDEFGWSVAVDGDVVIVGARYEDTGGSGAGAAYLFERNAGGTNTWDEVKKIQASDKHGDLWYGWSVAVAGDVTLIGAPGDDDKGVNAGAAYVMPVSDKTKEFTEAAKRTASDAGANDYFGCSAAVDGDVLIAGAYGENSGGSDAGAAYIFERNFDGMSNWKEVKKIMASDAQADDFFGFSAAVAGDVAVVGAYGEDSGSAEAGAAYVFERNIDGTNTWNEVKKLTASDAETDDFFGYSVAVAGDVAIVGALHKNTNAGAAYIFERNIGGTNAWSEVKKLVPSDVEADDFFGCSVAVAGDVAVVGSRWDDDAGGNAGAAYVFERNFGGTNNWGKSIKIIASDAEANDQFGISAAVEGDVAVVGAYTENAGGISDAGAAYVFERNANGGTNNWGEVKKLTASDAQADDYFGIRVAVDGDVAVVGASNESEGGPAAGAAYVFQRNASDTNAWGEIKKLIASDAQANDYFRGLAVAGDVIIAGAAGEDSEGSDAGAIYIFEEFIILPPKVNNNTGAIDIAEISATLRGEITYTGGENPDVTIFWGDNDSGTTGSWDNSINIGDQNSSFSTNITGFEQIKTYYYRCYATNSGGESWADSTTNFTTFAFPIIDITNTPEIVLYPDSASEISGTNLYVEGQLGIINDRYPGTTNFFEQGFSTNIFNIEHGDNLITVFGTNILGTIRNDTVIIHRETFAEVHPFIQITNDPAIVAFNVSSAEISGTNLNIAGNLGIVNDRHPETTNFIAQGFSTTILNLEYGDNLIEIFGINIYNHFTNDFVAIHRETFEEVHPFIKITNAPIVNFDISSAEISGTNLNIAGNLGIVNGQHPETTNFFAPGFSVSAINIEHGDNLIEIFGTNLYNHFTNDTVTIHRETWAEVHPFIKITNAPQEVNFDISSAEISGTNLNIAGNLAIVNDRHPETTNFFSQGFSVTANNLEHGDNVITIFGANSYNYFTNDTVSIHRETFAEVHPFIEITNAPAEVAYNISSAEITGTNLNIAGQLEIVNHRHPEVTNFFAQGFSVIVNNLEHENNVIQIFGTNVYGMFTNDNVLIHRETFAEVHPLIEITNAPAEIAYNISSADISGTNLNIAGQLGIVNNQHPETTNYFAQGFSVSANNLEHGDNVIEIFGTNVYGLFTNDVVSTHRETFGDVHPLIVITSHNTTVGYDVTSYTIAGINNANVVGVMNWTNSLTGESGGIQVSNLHFIVSNINLEHGDNLIEIMGTNIYGHSTNSVVSIHRETFGDVHPFIDITNAPMVVAYDVSSAEISGTNLNIAGQLGIINDEHPEVTNFFAQGFFTTISNLEHGDNLITILGTNIYNHFTNDAVTIHRETFAEVHPFIDITNPNATVTYDVKTYTISGTNNANVVGGMWWTNLQSGANGDFQVQAFAGQGFQVPDIPLVLGPNKIIVYGTNSYGDVTNDYVSVFKYNIDGSGEQSGSKFGRRLPGIIIGWGNNTYGQTNCPASENYVAVAAGRHHSLALKNARTLTCWGDDNYGQTNCPAGSNYVAVAGGGRHSLALKSDGTLTGWGYNNRGQTNCPAGSNYVAIAAGMRFSLALKSDGTLTGWGENSEGQTNCPAGENYVAVAAGGFHSLALKSDGSLIGWGRNDEGQTTCPAGNNYIAVAAGYLHSLALKSDGTLTGWGNNISGQTNCPAGNNYIAVSGGSDHSLALKSDGTLIGWGFNIYGQSSCPAGTNFLAVVGGGEHSLAIGSVASEPHIATNALIFPSSSSVLLAPFPTNIIWDTEKITDGIDGTNLTITKISVHLASTTNELTTVTNDVSNLLGEIPWLVPENLIGGDTNYVLKFEVVDSTSLTNSRIFWDNKFTVVPETGIMMILSLVVISALRRVIWLRCH